MIRYLTALSLFLACWVTVASQGSASTMAGGTAWKQPHLIVNNDLSNWTTTLPQNSPASRALLTPAAVHDAFMRSLAEGQFPGADGQSLLVQYSMFPWWKGKLYTLSDHIAFLKKLAYFAGEDPAATLSPGLKYMQSGGDFIKDFLNSPSPQMKILSFRLNDYHYNWNYDLWKSKSKTEILGEAKTNHGPYCDGASLNVALTAQEFAQSSFTAYFDALATGKLDPSLDGRCEGKLCTSAAEFAQQCSGRKCLVQSPSKCLTLTADFSKPVVRKLKLMQLLDLVSAYKTDAIEIDFNRNPQDFGPAVTPEQRVQIMTQWLADVRTALKATAPGLKLGIRVAGREVHRRVVGIDLAQINQRGLVDYEILASPVLSDQQADYPAPGAAHVPFYLEMTDLITSGDLARSNADDPTRQLHFRYPTTPDAFTTAALLAYRHGAFGMALFNTQYFGLLGGGEGDIDVPAPTSALSCMASLACVAQRDQHYFVGTNHYGLPKTEDQLPFRLNQAAPAHAFTLAMTPPDGGWAPSGMVRIGFVVRKGQPDQNGAPGHHAAGDALAVSVNGVALGGAPQWPARMNRNDKSDAYASKLWVGDARFSRTFAIDSKVLKDGTNSFQVKIEGPLSSAVEISNFEIFLPRRAAHP